MPADYHWPTWSEWEALEPSAKLAVAIELKALADERRDPKFKGFETAAQALARTLYSEAHLAMRTA